jgi:diguanylate cyclase (GGDEF)-like protein
VRRPDAAFRWGGDEFAVLLPDTAGPGAAFVAARIAAEVFRTCSDAGGAALTIGVGTAEHVPGTGAERLLARADAALFEVKDRQAA